MILVFPLDDGGAELVGPGEGLLLVVSKQVLLVGEVGELVCGRHLGETDTG